MRNGYFKKKLISSSNDWNEYNKRELYNELFGYVFTDCFIVASGILKSTSDAEDIVLTTIAYIFKMPIEKLVKDICCGPNVKGYFCIAVRNRCFNFLRDRQKRKTIEIVENADYDLNSASIQSIDYILMREDISNALSELSDTERLIFTLKEIDGYSHREIVEMGVVSKVTNSTSILYRTKKKLRQLLK